MTANINIDLDLNRCKNCGQFYATETTRLVPEFRCPYCATKTIRLLDKAMVRVEELERKMRKGKK
jgi:Zn finger protein HypA/HybF involved in hydrogenase expression